MNRHRQKVPLGGKIPNNLVESMQQKPQVEPIQQPRVNIDINRKLMTHAIVAQLRDTAKAKEMLAGSAVTELVEEYDRIRYLAEALVTAHERGKKDDVEKVIGIFRMLL